MKSAKPMEGIAQAARRKVIAVCDHSMTRG